MYDSTIRLALCNMTGFDYKRKTVSFAYLAVKCRNAECPLGIFGCPFDDDVNCTDVTAEMWENYFWPCCDEGDEDGGRADG